MIIITTERLNLRTFKLIDRDFLYELDNNKVVNKFRSTDERTMDFCIEQINNWNSRYNNDLLNVYLIELRENKVPVGLIFLVRKDNNRIELGYRLLDIHWGRGYCSEACNLLLIEYFKRNNDNVYAETHAKNINSIKLLSKLGFEEIEYSWEYNCREFQLEKTQFSM
ncbi:GNAT family N-acetyltransferase [Vallitalea guaymasensis]|uniref:GNAT family N-acetyltransferase n=1 Tax=Vallitalea guaymasensis TaxID=1185412 RepID=A0A8J8MFI5_9FIRM|nr:GNAT family N-acetyltransferase [Vallitalea guaymasensis]